MPLYEYECEACGKRFERIQKFSDPPIDLCPHCGESRVRKLPSSPAIQFKGSGFYITDYPKKSSSEAGSKSGSGGDAGSSSTGDSKTTSESKPADTTTKSPDKKD